MAVPVGGGGGGVTGVGEANNTAGDAPKKEGGGKMEKAGDGEQEQDAEAEQFSFTGPCMHEVHFILS